MAFSLFKQVCVFWLFFNSLLALSMRGNLPTLVINWRHILTRIKFVGNRPTSRRPRAEDPRALILTGVQSLITGNHANPISHRVYIGGGSRIFFTYVEKNKNMGGRVVRYGFGNLFDIIYKYVRKLVRNIFTQQQK